MLLHVLQYFNPRSHERSDIEYSLDLDNIIISIHAPTRGATCEPIEFLKRYCISIHAPTRGATLTFCIFPPFLKFQSTLPREERRNCQNSFSLTKRFQSTLPREERHKPPYPITRHDTFQSTLPREERPRWVRLDNFLCYFNPRSHERSDISAIFTPH